MLHSYTDHQYHFREIFNDKTGFYARTGILKDGVDTGEDPFMRSFPSLIDVGIMGHCAHGKSGLCQKAGIQCYQDAPHSNARNMTLDDYKRIIDEGSIHGLFSVALGGAGDPDMHEDFEAILKYSVENHVVPNFTTSGLGLTPAKAKLCKQYCGAIAVSMYSRIKDNVEYVAMRRRDEQEERHPYASVEEIPAKWTFHNVFDQLDERFTVIPIETLCAADMNGNHELFRLFEERETDPDIPNYTMNAIKMLLDAGVKTNIHYVLGNNTIDEALTRIKYNGFPAGINAVIFLLHKPIGLGLQSNVLQYDDPKVAEFFSLINKGNLPYKVGFDSCTVPGLLNMTDNIMPESVDSCEGGRFSMYITADMKALPCSFDNQQQKWAYDISNDTILNAWNSKAFNNFRKHFKTSCPDCPKRKSCYGGCPICTEITLCKDKKFGTCENCKHFLGGGDWNLCCDLPHPDYPCGFLCYGDTPACKDYCPVS